MQSLVDWFTRNITHDEEFTNWLIAAVLFILIVVSWKWALELTNTEEVFIGLPGYQLTLDEL